MGKRADSDESYILNLCDEILGVKAVRQKRFDFLRGDPSKSRPRGITLPVDAYYEECQLVVEYREKQHYEDVPLFDKKQTISNISRKEQRRKYDLRREEILPKHNLRVITIPYYYFEYDANKKLLRNREADIAVLKKLFLDK